MDAQRLEAILARFPAITVLVIGDYFLDKYLIIDRRLSEVSLETGLEAFQVVEVRPSPGAAGTVASNLRALGVGVVALGVVGDDGEGYELKRGLEMMGVDTEPLVQVPDLLTPTYTKPLLRETDGRVQELNRLDIVNRAPLLPEIEDAVISRLRQVIERVQGVIVADQVRAQNCGVVTDRVRDEIVGLAHTHPEVIFAADSRERIGLFRHVILKPNAREAMRAVRPNRQSEATRVEAEECGAELYRQCGRPVFVTLGLDGVLVCDDHGCQHVPAVPIAGPIDIVGAGDSTMAGIVSALCAGASPGEAALIGNLVASITIQQVGTTGTASPEQVRERFGELTGISLFPGTSAPSSRP